MPDELSPTPYEGRPMSKSRDLSTFPNQSLAFKNRIINGAMQVWQRGTSFTNPSVGGSFYTADRWGVNRSGDASGATVSRSTDVPTGFQYSLRLQRTAGDSNTAGLFLFNSNESVNTLDLAGEQVTLSFWAKTGANYSGGALTVVARSGTGIDQRVYAYTGSATVISQNVTINSTWTRYSFTGTVPSNSTEAGFQLSWTPSGTAGADDSVYLTGFQLEKSPTATAFEFRDFGDELRRCQRYFQKSYSHDTAPGTVTNSNILIWYPDATTNYASITSMLLVDMRSSPTYTIYSSTGASARIRNSDNGVDLVALANGASSNSFHFVVNNTSVGQSVTLRCHFTASAEL